jgi:hypothetical protein
MTACDPQRKWLWIVRRDTRRIGVPGDDPEFRARITGKFREGDRRITPRAAVSVTRLFGETERGGNLPSSNT